MPDATSGIVQMDGGLNTKFHAEGKSEYKKLKPNMVYDYGQAYDIKSIMQYHAASFSLNGWVAVMHDLTGNVCVRKQYFTCLLLYFTKLLVY